MQCILVSLQVCRSLTEIIWNHQMRFFPYFNEFKKALNELIAAGGKLNDQKIWKNMIKALPQSYSYYCRIDRYVKSRKSNN